MDVCTFGFECMSRCCVGNMCSHFLNCYQKCERNDQCTDEITPCCSQGYCTDTIVCAGNKSTGDTCTHSSECLTDYCDASNLVCRTKPDLSISTQPTQNIWIIIILLAFFAVLIFICIRKWFAQKLCQYGDSEDRYTRGHSDEQLSKTDRERRRGKA